MASYRVSVGCVRDLMQGRWRESGEAELAGLDMRLIFACFVPGLGGTFDRFF